MYGDYTFRIEPHLLGANDVILMTCYGRRLVSWVTSVFHQAIDFMFDRGLVRPGGRMMDVFHHTKTISCVVMLIVHKVLIHDKLKLRVFFVVVIASLLGLKTAESVDEIKTDSTLIGLWYSTLLLVSSSASLTQRCLHVESKPGMGCFLTESTT